MIASNVPSLLYPTGQKAIRVMEESYTYNPHGYDWKVRQFMLMSGYYAAASASGVHYGRDAYNAWCTYKGSNN